MAQAGLRPSTVFLVALSLSIGWGIRGNFGHEYGAMIAGCLAALAVCLCSGREDWKRRAPYFAFFGALGWGFGGSISYMQVIAYTHSGHLPSQAYGFFGVFLIGFLWAALGGAGTALPAVLERKELTALFKPLLYIFVAWTILALYGEAWEALLTARAAFELGVDPHTVDATWNRHASPLYWLDSDWLQALAALLAVCYYDLAERGTKNERTVPYAALCAGLVTLALQVWLNFFGGLDAVLALLESGPWGGLAYGVQAIASCAALPVLAAVLAGLLPVFLAAHALNVFLLPLLAALGALLGGLAQWGLEALGWAKPLAAALLQPLCDPLSATLPDGTAPGEADILYNWPQLFLVFPGVAGPIVGVACGLALYFALFGRFRNGASLFLWMACGWFAAFIALPVLGDLPVAWVTRALSEGEAAWGGFGGIRMTPPRGDNWAGVLGVVIAVIVWMQRQGYSAVTFATLTCGFIGGITYSGAQCLKLLATAWGSGYAVTRETLAWLQRNPLPDPALQEQRLLAATQALEAQEALKTVSVAGKAAAEGAVHQAAQAYQALVPSHQHWQSANWHSVLEQMQGFGHGIALAIALGFLASRLPIRKDEVRFRRWTEGFSVWFVVIGLTFLNLFKNVEVWAYGEGAVMPGRMRLPLFWSEWTNWSAGVWFGLVYLALAIVTAVLLRAHLRRPLPLVPESALGRGQLLFLVFLWVIVLGNFERALPRFAEARLITEWVITMNAVLATALVLLLPRTHGETRTSGKVHFGRDSVRACFIGVGCAAFACMGYLAITRAIYADNWTGHSGHHMRSGPQADWRIKPNLRTKQHR